MRLPDGTPISEGIVELAVRHGFREAVINPADYRTLVQELGPRLVRRSDVIAMVFSAGKSAVGPYASGEVRVLPDYNCPRGELGPLSPVSA